MMEEMNNVIIALNKLIAATPPEYDALAHEAAMIRDAFYNRKNAIEEMISLQEIRNST
jgi:hypothetical protein